MLSRYKKSFSFFGVGVKTFEGGHQQEGAIFQPFLRTCLIITLEPIQFLNLLFLIHSQQNFDGSRFYFCLTLVFYLLLVRKKKSFYL